MTKQAARRGRKKLSAQWAEPESFAIALAVRAPSRRRLPPADHTILLLPDGEVTSTRKSKPAREVPGTVGA